jgi:double zinc ribbon protein/adenylate/guanylate cyclase family protein
MICAACRHENPARAKFCLECGARLAPSCPQCGTELPPAAKFCLECGHRLAAPDAAPLSAAASAPGSAARPPSDAGTRLASYTPKHLAEKILKSRSALEGERRQVTVLFADLAGFTTLAEKLDPEEVHRIIEHCFEEFDGEPEIIAKVEHAMRRMGELEAQIPYVRFLLSVDPGDPAVGAMDALNRRKKVFEAVRMLSLRGARLQPIVLVSSHRPNPRNAPSSLG